MKPNTDNPPLISCIMPTYNRRAFVSQAIAYFLRQDYDKKELIIVDDGDDAVGDLMPSDGRIRYIYIGVKKPIGTKRNLACQEARGGIIIHWDDDDWHAPHQLSYQVEALLRENTDVCGVRTILFYDLQHHKAWHYTYSASQPPWLAGNSLCYTKAFWASNHFPDINVGEDTRFVSRARPECMTVLPDSTFYVGIIHEHNVFPKRPDDVYWRPYPIEDIQRLIGDDWTFYHSEQAVGSTYVHQPQRESIEPIESGRNIPMLTVAKKTDLDLPEYAAFNFGQSLPQMRRWELPFALFQARLANTMSILDCTINPVNFQERLLRLYPHTLYRYWNPIQNNQFALPFGIPDEAFDRVICVNTLEHLLRPQREALIAAMARKLKPGGLLLVTSDYYFDSSWQKSLFLQAGVMRPDGQEIFNGWNKVRLQEWQGSCNQHNLYPMCDPGEFEEPREDDPMLYLHEGYPHACMAGVFYKAPHPQVPVGKKVVLALLTWNTCNISLESVRAYVREARMLQRLGQIPFICICDNGSTDGTPEALQALKAQIEIPHRFILNQENLGSSIARNQIIDYMRECDADYLLFMDGDIEIVPFSSFAMLRYMENSGHKLGCIGADCLGYTPNRAQVSACYYTIDGCKLETTSLLAWTQYGMFRRAVFEDGCRFEENAPFNQVGWGFEDNDLAFQMEMKGYLNQRFFGMTYLHRAARSSIRIMREQGVDVTTLYRQRKQYVIDKWAATPQINNGPLVDVRRAYIR